MDVSSDCELLITAIRKAGEIARKFFQSDFDTWQKGKNDPVTEVDIAIDHLLRTELTSARPDYGWLSEETKDSADRLGKDRVWVVDPIDGTRAFVKGKPHFTICGALVEKGQSVVGAVYNPVTDELYSAMIGKGAKCNGQAIQVSTQDDIEGCRMIGSEPLFKHPDWKRPWPDMHIESRNSVALRMVLVASGKWDASISLSRKSDWDLAGADLIMREAGGLATDHTGGRFDYNKKDPLHPSVVVAGPVLHSKLIDRVAHIKLPAS